MFNMNIFGNEITIVRINKLLITKMENIGVMGAEGRVVGENKQ